MLLFVVDFFLPQCIPNKYACLISNQFQTIKPIYFLYFQVPSNNNEDTTKTPVSGVVANWQSADLGGKVQELHDTLGRLRQEAEDSIERVRQESEDKIERLKRESDDATKTIAKLQMQLEQQSDYDLLKREVQ